MVNKNGKKEIKDALKRAKEERKAAAKERKRKQKELLAKAREEYNSKRCHYKGLVFRCRTLVVSGQTLCEYHAKKEAQRAKREAAYRQRVEKAKNLRVSITSEEEVLKDYLRRGYCIYQGNSWWNFVMSRVCGKPVAPGSPLCQEHTDAHNTIVERERKLIIEEEQKQQELKLEEERRKEENRQLLIAADARRSVTSYWKNLSGKDFELEFAALMRRYGYEITEMSSGSDEGKDIVAIKDGKKVIVQCKATETPVSQGVVRDLYGTMIHASADKAILVSVSGFSENTRKFAEGKPIELVGLEQIIKLSQNASSYGSKGAQRHLDSGVSFLEEGKLDSAIRDFLEAIRLNPDYAEAHFNLGAVYSQKGFYDLAIRQYEEAIRLKPDYAEAHLNLGWVYGQKGLYDLEIRQYEEAIRLKPDYVEAHYNLGWVYYYTKALYDLAIRQFEEAIRLKPNYALAHCLLGAVYSDKGLYDLAKKHLQQAVLIKPDLTKAQELLDKLCQ